MAARREILKPYIDLTPTPVERTVKPSPTTTTASTYIYADACTENIPDSLSFLEPLINGLTASGILIYSGGHSYERRTSGFGALTSKCLRDFCDHHGYNLVFLDELKYEPVYNGTAFSPQWHRVFAYEHLKAMYPHVKYIVWIDDDILIPYPETHMLNHYINKMEEDTNIEMMLADDIDIQELNTGMMVMRNSQFTSWVVSNLPMIGLEFNAHFATEPLYEQDCLKILRHRHALQTPIRVIHHRDGRYNFNSLVNVPGMKARPTDAFIHFLGISGEARAERMKVFLHRATVWRASVPSNCTYPIQT